MRSISVSLIVIAALLTTMYLAIYVRSGTLSSPTVLDYDPWWFFRHAKEIVENGMVAPKWDELTYFPPGSPYERFMGWSYTLAYFYKFLGAAIGLTLTDVAKWSTPIAAALTVIPAFLLGRSLSNKWGGVCTAIFGVLTPALIGVSMAGYCDTDMVVVFYSFLSVYSILIAMKKKVSIRSLPYFIFAILVNLAFVFTWGYGWIILLFFAAFIPAFFVFRAIENMLHQRSFKLNTAELKAETQTILPLLIILVVTNVVGQILSFGNIIQITLMGVGFTRGEILLVNMSVAELQKISIFTREGLQSIVDRTGLAPLLFTFLLPVLALYKIYKKEKIGFAEIFLFLWVVTTVVLIEQGVRFSLIFSTAAATAAGYAVGNVPKYLTQKTLQLTFFGLTCALVLIFVSNAISAGYSAGDMEISQNWYGMLDWINANTDQKSLLVTWWDPGHILAGYTGRRVMADGAHCGVGMCIPYNHNIRIQDMGRAFSTGDEQEAVSILTKYRQLSPAGCEEARQAYGNIIPADACDAVPEMYVIASSDLIGKYYWLSYFGTGNGRNFIQMSRTSVDQSQGVVSFGGGAISLAYKDGSWVPVLNMPDQGIRNTVIRNLVYFENGQEKRMSFNETNMVDGMLWVDPSYSTVIFMDSATRDSIFTRMFFFNGEGLQHFQLVYQNSEIRLYKVVW